jgi:hypothetical protein
MIIMKYVTTDDTTPDRKARNRKGWSTNTKRIWLRIRRGWGESVQWKRCLERVSFGMYSATSSLSSPSAQQPIRLTRRLWRTFPTPAASACNGSHTASHCEIQAGGQIERKQATNAKSYEELLRVRPGEAREALDGDEAAAVEAAAVDDVGRLLAALGDDKVGAESLGGGAQLGQRELPEHRHRALQRLLVVGGVAAIRAAVRRLCHSNGRKRRAAD